MKSLFFLITSDPRTSHRPAEAIRIAAGVGVWKEVAIKLYFRDAAVLALSEYPEGLVDEEIYTRYLPGMREFGCPIYAQRNAPLLAQVGRTPIAFEEIEDERLALLAAHSTSLLRF